MPVHFKIIQHSSDEYDQMLALRTDVLLRPIGVDPSYIQVPQEKTDILIGAFDNAELIGCCVLTPKNSGLVQLRQMAVAKHLQGQGLGAAIMQFAEQMAREKGSHTLMLHARSPVVPFYKKNAYTIVGEPFEEVGIQHFRMEKLL